MDGSIFESNVERLGREVDKVATAIRHNYYFISERHLRDRPEADSISIALLQSRRCSIMTSESQSGTFVPPRTIRFHVVSVTVHWRIKAIIMVLICGPRRPQDQPYAVRCSRRINMPRTLRSNSCFGDDE